VNEQDRDDVVDEALDRLSRTAPPADLVDSVMAEVSAAESQMTAWRRWRRALQGRRLTNFLAGARVGSSQRQFGRSAVHGGVVVRNKILWAVTGFAAAALVSVFVLGYPPIGRGTEATIGVAQRYQGSQISAKDINVPDSEVQQFVQSEQFDRLLKDSVTRNALKELFGNEAMATAIASPNVAEAMASPAVREALLSRQGREAIAMPGVAEFLGGARFAENVAKVGVAEALSKEYVFQALGKTAAAEALINRSVVEALAKEGVFQAIGKAGVINALVYRNVAEAMVRSGMLEAFAKAEFAAAINASAMHTALNNAAFRSAISSALAR